MSFIRDKQRLRNNCKKVAKFKTPRQIKSVTELLAFISQFGIPAKIMRHRPEFFEIRVPKPYVQLVSSMLKGHLSFVENQKDLQIDLLINAFSIWEFITVHRVSYVDNSTGAK